MLFTRLLWLGVADGRWGLEFLRNQIHVDVFRVERPCSTGQDIHDDSRSDPENISKDGRTPVKVSVDRQSFRFIPIFLYRDDMILRSP